MSDYIAWVNNLKSSRDQFYNQLDKEGGTSSTSFGIWVPPWIPMLWFEHDIHENKNAAVLVAYDETSDGEDKDEEADKVSTLTDVIMTRLRTSDGLDLDWIKNVYGEETVNSILRSSQLALDLNLAVIEESVSDDNGQNIMRSFGVLRLKDPDGFLFSNTIISSIFVELGVV